MPTFGSAFFVSSDINPLRALRYTPKRAIYLRCDIPAGVRGFISYRMAKSYIDFATGKNIALQSNISPYKKLSNWIYKAKLSAREIGRNFFVYTGSPGVHYGLSWKPRGEQQGCLPRGEKLRGYPARGGRCWGFLFPGWLRDHHLWAFPSGERWERRLWREERPERVAAVDRCQGAPSTQADVGHRNRKSWYCCAMIGIDTSSRRSTSHNSIFSASGKYHLCRGFSSPHKAGFVGTPF